MISVWGRRSSFNVQKVLWLLEELGVPYESIPRGGSFGGLDAAEFGRMNPHRRVPVLADGDVFVWESHSILRYLAAVHGNGNSRFWHVDPVSRSNDDRWMDWMLATLQPDFLTGVFWGFYRTPPAERNWPAIRQSLEVCSAHFTLLDRTLDGRAFINGDRIGLADICVGTSLYRYFSLDIERPTVPNVEAWYDRLKERAPYRDNVMIPFGDMEGRLSF